MLDDVLLCLLALVVGASPGVPPRLTLGQCQIRQEGSQGPLYLIGFATESVLSGAVVRALPIETHVVGWEWEQEHIVTAQ